MNIISSRIEKLRSYLKNNDLDAVIIPSSDSHFGEYIKDRYKVREYVTGFTGSAGVAVISLKDAALWTDSRYFVQARQELEGTGVKLMKIKMPDTPSIEEWIISLLKCGSKVAVDGSLFSVDQYNSLKIGLGDIKLVVVDDYADEIWPERPAVVNSQARFVPDSVSGASSSDKLVQIADCLDIAENYFYMLSSCDDIAWLCNIRGADIDFNPLLYSYVVFNNREIHLFVSSKSLNSKVRSFLELNSIIIHDYEGFELFLQSMDPGIKRCFCSSSFSVKNYRASHCNDSNTIRDSLAGGVVSYLKSHKNDAEIGGFRRAMINDAVAWIKLLRFIEDALPKKDKNIFESTVAGKLAEFRGENPDYHGESFSPIAAYGKNAALPHYSFDVNNPVEILREGFLLIDAGAHYTYGTTDTTRTIACGPVSDKAKNDYTRVLKGMINLSRAVFPYGTRGSSLDILARGEVCRGGKVYMHGTGHGIGHNLCVHEGPQSIRMEENPVSINPGMILSNEPAVYVEEEYGIRIENTLLCKELKNNKYGRFCCFETISLIPIDKQVVNLSLLSGDEINWINNYHREVFEKLSPFMDESLRLWLSEKTSDISD